MDNRQPVLIVQLVPASGQTGHFACCAAFLTRKSYSRWADMFGITAGIQTVMIRKRVRMAMLQLASDAAA